MLRELQRDDCVRRPGPWVLALHVPAGPMAPLSPYRHGWQVGTGLSASMGLLLETQDALPAHPLLIPVFPFRVSIPLLGPMGLDLLDRHPSALTGIFPGAA